MLRVHQNPPPGCKGGGAPLPSEAAEDDNPVLQLAATAGWRKIITAGIVAGRGMIAGCVSATRELKCYLKTTLQGVIIRNPAIELDSWVDDLNLEGHGSNLDVLESVAKTAALDLQAAVKDECLLEFAGMKTTTVASKAKLAKGVARAVGHKQAKDRGACHQAKSLGIDQTAGKCVRQRGQTQETRLLKSKKRVRQARRVLGKAHRQMVVWKTGTLPAASFGSAV